MHLIRLEIDNFRVIRHARLDFPDSVTAIVGPNGAGKSSIIEAITWVLYGSTASRTSESGIKATFALKDQPCRVSLEFSINDDRYKIERRLVGRSDKAEVALFRNSASESVGVRETVNYVAGLLGLNFHGFKTSFLARQQELNALSDLVPSKRQDHLAGMLGVERLDKIIDRVKADTKMAKSNYEILEEQISRWSESTAKISELTAEIEKLAEQKDQATAKTKAAKKALDDASSKLTKDQEKQSNWQIQYGKLESEEESLERTSESLKQIAEEKERLIADQAALKMAEGELADFDKITAEFERLSKAQEQLVRKEAAKKRLKEEEAVFAKTEKELEKAAKRVEQLEGELGRIPGDIEEQKKRADEELEQARQKFADLRAAQNNRKAEIDSLKKQIDGIDTVGGKSICDRCGRPFGEDIDEIRKHLSGEIAKLTEELAGNETVLDLAEQDGAAQRKKTDQLAEQAKKKVELKGSLEAASATDKQLQSSLEQSARRCAELKAEIAALGELDFDLSALKKAKARKEELEQLQKMAAQLQGRLERLPQVEKELQRLKVRLDQTTREISLLKESIAKIGFSKEHFEKTMAELNRVQQEYESCREKSVEAEQKVKLVENDLKMAKVQNEKLKKSRAEAETLKEDHYYGEKIARLMAEFKKHVIARIRPTLASFAGDLVREMTADRYSLIELDEQYNLRLMDDGEFYDIERYSGGEKDLANLCLRLAISQALTESAGMQRSFIILDEVFGSQDAERRQLIVDALAGLKRSFNQIILITHIEEIKDSVEDLIIVRPTGQGWSEVIVGGNGHGEA